MGLVEQALLWSLAAIWGASYLFIKVAVVEINPVALVAVRLLIGAAGLLAITWATVRGGTGASPPSTGVTARVRAWPLWLRSLVLGFFGAIVPWLLIAWGELFITSGSAAVLNATAPFFSTLFGHWLGFWGREERLTGDRAAGLLLGVAGVVALVSGSEGGSGAAAGGMELAGYLAIMGSSVSYGIGALFARLAFAGSPPLVAATAQITGGAAVMTPLALLFALPSAAPSVEALASVLGLGVLGTVVGYILYYQLLSRIGATGGLSVTFLIPVFALAYGALLLDEAITIAAVGGLALILAGVGLTTGMVRLPGLTSAGRGRG